MNNKTFMQATKISILNYKAQYTDNPTLMIQTIEKKLKSIARNDNYSEASLMISLTHLYLLTGNMEKAKKHLNSSQKIIFANASPRQKAKWHFENSYYYFLSSKVDLALFSLDQALEYIDQNFELPMTLKILGLKRKIYSLLKKDTKTLDEKLIQLTLKIGDPQAINKLARIQLLNPEISEDPLQIAFDHFFYKKNYHEILDYGFWGLLRGQHELSSHHHQSSYYLTDLWKNSLIIIAPNLTVIHKTGISTLILTAFKAIVSKKTISKEELVQTIWGYQYDPLRHDTLLYGLIHRIREILGPLSKELIGENHQYSFQLSMKKIQLLSPNLNKTKDSTVFDENLQERFKKTSKWNIRQHKIIDRMRKGESFKVSDYAKLFNVSSMTALRDLTELHKASIVTVFGRARATTYAILNSTDF